MPNLGRPSVWDQYGDQMQQMYEQQNLSRGEIARFFGTSVQSVTRVLGRRGVAFEDRLSGTKVQRTPEQQEQINARISAARKGKGTGPRKPPEMRTCENRSCGKEFEYRAGQTGERFCSRVCRNEYASFVNKEAAEEAYGLDPKRCPCGTAIPFEYRHTRQFCSPEHRKEYQAKRQKDPANWVTLTCQRPACGKEFTLPRSYTSYGKYCSNECAAKHTRIKQHIVVDDAVVLDSGFEALFWGLCSFWKIPVERADRSEAVEIGENGWYCPDFRIQIPHLKLDLWIEVKGFEDDDDRARYTAWRETGRILAVVGREELDALREAARPAAFIARLHLIENGRLLNEEPW